MRINNPQLVMAKVKYEAMTEAQQADWLHVSDSLTQFINNEKIIERSLEKSVVVMVNNVGCKANTQDRDERAVEKDLCPYEEKGLKCLNEKKCPFEHR